MGIIYTPSGITFKVYRIKEKKTMKIMTLVSVIRPKPQCYFSDEINQNSCNNNIVLNKDNNVKVFYNIEIKFIQIFLKTTTF